MNLRDYKTVEQRRRAVEDKYALSLKHIGSFTLSEQHAASKNCENMIGAVQVPIGIAGPLKIHNEEFMIPLATTEGALVASISRGCKALTETGGVDVMLDYVGVTRAPVFRVDNLSQARKLTSYVENNFKKIKKITESSSSHLSLIKITPYMVGKNVFLRCHFDTQDAMGMNMVTIALAKLIPVIEDETGVNCVALSGNMCTDKKPSALNFIDGRGYRVWAEAKISSEKVQAILHTESQRIVEVAQRKLMYGSALAGSFGFNAQYANVLAAIYLATGQDLGHIAECAIGITTVELLKHDTMYISVYLPDILLGTVGGGTELSTQLEALSILGLRGGNSGKNAQKLAKITAAAVLAGELSLLASLAEKSLDKAHRRLGRGEI